MHNSVRFNSVAPQFRQPGYVGMDPEVCQNLNSVGSFWKLSLSDYYPFSWIFSEIVRESSLIFINITSRKNYGCRFVLIPLKNDTLRCDFSDRCRLWGERRRCVFFSENYKTPIRKHSMKIRASEIRGPETCLEIKRISSFPPRLLMPLFFFHFRTLLK